MLQSDSIVICAVTDGEAEARPAEDLGLLQRATAVANSPLPLPRCLLLFAHPDDETLALGARLSRFDSALLVHVTDGSPRSGEDARSHGLTVDQYRETRSMELAAALHRAGLAPMRRECMGFPDQEAACNLPLLTQRVTELLSAERPDVVFTHPYEGGHPDHDATAFAAHRAMRQLQLAGEPVPVILEAAFYHAGPNGMETECFLPSSPATSVLKPHQHELSDELVHELTYELSPEEQEGKRTLLRCFATQGETLQYFPLKQERFRLAPVYDFSLPPHTGPAFYDRFSWGMTSVRFCELAVAASVSEEDAPSAAPTDTRWR